MKKVLAVLFAVMFAFSACIVAFAADGGTVCDYCGEKFATMDEFQKHIDGTFPVKDHKQECEFCFEVFTSKAAYDAHKATCETVEDHKLPCKYKDNGCKDTFKTKAEYEEHIKSCAYAGLGTMIAEDPIAAIKYAINKVVEFFKNETVQKVLGTVKDLLGKIDLGKVVSTVKGVAEKIPFDTIISKVKEVVA